MSYCRWSSDDWACELYCYESIGGWVTHVAAYKRVNVPKIGKMPNHQSPRVFKKWMKKYKAQMVYLETAEMRAIGLPYDGQTFNDADIRTFKERLLYLRGVGYKFPDYVLETIDQEILDTLEFSF